MVSGAQAGFEQVLHLPWRRVFQQRCPDRFPRCRFGAPQGRPHIADAGARGRSIRRGAGGTLVPSLRDFARSCNRLYCPDAAPPHVQVRDETIAYLLKEGGLGPPDLCWLRKVRTSLCQCCVCQSCLHRCTESASACFVRSFLWVLMCPEYFPNRADPVQEVRYSNNGPRLRTAVDENKIICSLCDERPIASH